MLIKRLFIYLLLASSLILNVWFWFNRSNAPQLDKIVLKYPVENLGFVYGVSTNGGGATVGFSYRYYLSTGKSTDEEILSSLVGASPFLVTKDSHINIESSNAMLNVRVTGRIDQFHNQAVLRRDDDDYEVVNINLTSSSGASESM